MCPDLGDSVARTTTTDRRSRACMHAMAGGQLVGSLPANRLELIGAALRSVGKGLEHACLDPSPASFLKRTTRGLCGLLTTKFARHQRSVKRRVGFSIHKEREASGLAELVFDWLIAVWRRRPLPLTLKGCPSATPTCDRDTYTTAEVQQHRRQDTLQSLLGACLVAALLLEGHHPPGASVEASGSSRSYCIPI